MIVFCVIIFIMGIKNNTSIKVFKRNVKKELDLQRFNFSQTVREDVSTHSLFTNEIPLDKTSLISIKSISDIDIKDLYQKGKKTGMIPDKEDVDRLAEKSIYYSPQKMLGDEYLISLFGKVSRFLGFNNETVLKDVDSRFNMLKGKNTAGKRGFVIPLIDDKQDSDFILLFKFEITSFKNDSLVNMFHKNPDNDRRKPESYTISLINKKNNKIYAEFRHDYATYGIKDFVLRDYSTDGDAKKYSYKGMLILAGVLDSLKNYDNRKKENKILSFK